MMNFLPAVVLLAAGRSRRMGQPKLLLPWGDCTVVAHLIRQWQRLNTRQIAVVVSSDATPLRVELQRLGIPETNLILNPDPERGMFSSIQCAAAWNGWDPGLSHFLVTLGDQPHVREETLHDLLNAARAQPQHICQPRLNGRRMHPVLLPRKQFIALTDGRFTTLKEYLLGNAEELGGFESQDQGLPLDLDTPEDYEQAKREFFPIRKD